MKTTLAPPPILLATRCLGWTDADVAKLSAMKQPNVAIWSTSGKIPPGRHAALIMMVIAVICEIWPREPKTPLDKQTKNMCLAAIAHVGLANDILKADCGGRLPQRLIDRAQVEAQKMLDRWSQGCARGIRPAQKNDLARTAAP